MKRPSIREQEMLAIKAAYLLLTQMQSDVAVAESFKQPVSAVINELYCAMNGVPFGVKSTK